MPRFYIQSGFKSSSFLCVELIWRHSFSWFVLTPIAFIVQLQPSVQLLCARSKSVMQDLLCDCTQCCGMTSSSDLIWDELHELLK